MTITGLFAGLGNPGERYDNTRHNIGFSILDQFCESLPRDFICGPERSKPKYALRRLETPKGDWLLLKPMTYMNLSGEAVGEVIRYYKMSPEQVLTVHDELDLPLGRLQLRFGGGAAGHRGVESLVQHLGSRDFHRLRVGVDKPATGETAQYVLQGFRPDEREVLEQVRATAVKTLRLFITQGMERARQYANSFRPVLEGSSTQGMD